MGHFYQNFTIRGVSRDDLVAALSGRKAFIGPVSGDCVVVFDRRSEDESNTELGLDISEQFNCPVLAVCNHDDDLLFYQLFEGMLPVDEYSSCPAYFDPAEPETPTGGDVQRLCAAFGSINVSEVEAILRKPSDESGYVMAFERHRDLVRALGLPSYAVGSSYYYISDGELPDGLSEVDLARTE
ncbi:MAG TPA: hypothetical protein VIT91_21460 [Chthoniobacterales bacterium]